jgi:uncharacterized protein (TIGR02001 family)
MRSTQTFSGLFLAALLAGAPAMPAEEAPLVSADLGYASRYVFRGVDKTGAATQAGLEFARDNFSGGLWTNQPFKRGEGSEVNLNAAYSAQVGKSLTLEASARNYWFDGGPAGATKHSFEAGVSATLAPIQGFTPGLAYYHDFRLRADTTQATLAYSIALTGIGTFLDLNLFAGSSTGDDWRPDAPGPNRHDSYGYWGAEAHLPYRIGLHSTLVAGLHYAEAGGRSTANGPFGLSGGQNLWFTLGVSLDF